MSMSEKRRLLLRGLEKGFLVAGLLGVGFYGAILLHGRLSQAAATVEFDRLLSEKGPAADHPSPAQAGPLALFADRRLLPPSPDDDPIPDKSDWSRERIRAFRSVPDTSKAIARLQVPDIGLSVMVFEGTDRWTLNRGAGHIPGTAFPGELGNVGIAGHRDGFFRSLRDIKPGQRIVLTTLHGTINYRVGDVSIVGPKDSQVLSSRLSPRLTLVTCYPFYYMGPSPKRFIVTALPS
jgi:LPXTG-site transpeptidase (sortase) family protein